MGVPRYHTLPLPALPPNRNGIGTEGNYRTMGKCKEPNTFFGKNVRKTKKVEEELDADKLFAKFIIKLVVLILIGVLLVIYFG